MSDANQTSKEFINKERREILHQIDTWLEIPMIGLSLVWTVLLIIEFVWGLNSFLNGVSITIWIIFILEFALTMGSDYFPKTPEGRMLCFLLAVYAFAIFGYLTATLATFFVSQDAN